MIRAIMHGCNGHMGQTITGLCADDEQIEIVAGVDPFDGIKNDYPVFPSLEACDVEADVIIDFASAAAVDDLLDYSVKHQIPVVLCTTGLSEEQLAKVEEASRKVAVLKSANMSLGINTLMDLLKKATSVFVPAGFDIEIVEKHHNQKVDAPSGTAIALADSMNEVLNNEYQYKYDRSAERKKREVFRLSGAETSWESTRLSLPGQTRSLPLSTRPTPRRYLEREPSRLPNSWRASRLDFTI